MNRLEQIEQALRDLAAAHDNQDWDAMEAAAAVEIDAAPDAVDPAAAATLLAKVNSLLTALSHEAHSVRTELEAQPVIRRAARAYLAADATAAPTGARAVIPRPASLGSS